MEKLCTVGMARGFVKNVKNIIAMNTDNKSAKILRGSSLYCPSQDDNTEGVILNASEESRFTFLEWQNCKEVKNDRQIDR